MIERYSLTKHIEKALSRNPVTALLGPRQCGKTTLARQFVAPKSVNYFDLEDPNAQQRLANPMLSLKELRGLIVLDEIQLRPDIFPVLRVLSDRENAPATFLVLGSARPDLLRQSSESLAGRIEFVPMAGFDLQEIGVENLGRYWLQGGFPLAYLRNEEDSLAWRKHFVTTFIQRDLPSFGHNVDTTTLSRLWSMLAHLNGQIVNYSKLAGSLGTSDATIRRHLQLLESYYLIRLLKPWHSNGKKREIKAPKMYLKDTGLLHSELRIHSMDDLLGHPAIGFSWESCILDQIVRFYPDREAYFWRAHTGAEIDLILRAGQKLIGFEIKRSDAPIVRRSHHEAAEYLHLDHLYFVYPGGPTYPVASNMTATTIQAILQGAGRV